MVRTYLCNKQRSIYLIQELLYILLQYSQQQQQSRGSRESSFFRSIKYAAAHSSEQQLLSSTCYYRDCRSIPYIVVFADVCCVHIMMNEYHIHVTSWYLTLPIHTTLRGAVCITYRIHFCCWLCGKSIKNQYLLTLQVRSNK